MPHEFKDEERCKISLGNEPKNPLDRFFSYFSLGFGSCQWMLDNKKDRIWLREYNVDIVLIRDERIQFNYKGNEVGRYRDDDMSEQDKQRLFTKLPAIMKELHKIGIANDKCYNRWITEHKNFIRDIIRDGKKDWEWA